jgi:hypothetical protein
MAAAQGVSFDRGTQVGEATYLFKTQTGNMACDLRQAVRGSKFSNMLVCERFKPSRLILRLNADQAPEVLTEGRDAGGNRMEDPIRPHVIWGLGDGAGIYDPKVLPDKRDAGGNRIRMGSPILPDGTWWGNKNFGCLSEKTRLTCKNRAGYGFVLTPTDFKSFTFPKPKLMGVVGINAYIMWFDPDQGTGMGASSYLFKTESEIGCFIGPETNDSDSKKMLKCLRFGSSPPLITLPVDKPPKVLTESGDMGGGGLGDVILPNDTWWANDDFGCLSEKTGLTCKNKAGFGFLLTPTSFKPLIFRKH